MRTHLAKKYSEVTGAFATFTESLNPNGLELEEQDIEINYHHDDVIADSYFVLYGYKGKDRDLRSVNGVLRVHMSFLNDNYSIRLQSQYGTSSRIITTEWFLISGDIEGMIEKINRVRDSVEWVIAGGNGVNDGSVDAPGKDFDNVSELESILDQLKLNPSWDRTIDVTVEPHEGATVSDDEITTSMHITRGPYTFTATIEDGEEVLTVNARDQKAVVSEDYISSSDLDEIWEFIARTSLNWARD